MSKQLSETEIVTGEVRLSYTHLFTPVVPESSAPGTKAKYSTCILIPKEDTKTIKLVRGAIKAAFEAGIQTKFGGHAPKAWHNPLRDGDEELEDGTKDAEKNGEIAGCFFVNCSSYSKPGLVDRHGQEIIDPEELKSGDYAKVDINFYAYSTNGNRGVACAVNNVLKTKDGEALSGGKMSAAAAFEGEFDAEDDDENLI